MLNLRENIKGLHLNQHQIEINMSVQFQILKNKIKKSNIHHFTVKYTTIDELLCIEQLKLLSSRMVQINKQYYDTIIDCSYIYEGNI